MLVACRSQGARHGRADAHFTDGAAAWRGSGLYSRCPSEFPAVPQSWCFDRLLGLFLVRPGPVPSTTLSILRRRRQLTHSKRVVDKFTERDD
jgi:hypothetical protein